MLKYFILFVGYFVSVQASHASCFNYEESGGSGPTVLMCIGDSCGETAATLECASSGRAQFGFDNGVSIECLEQGGVSECAISLGSRRVLDKEVTCTNLTDEPVCRGLPTPCDAYMGTIRTGFEAASESERMDAQAVLQFMLYYMNFDAIPAQPAEIDGMWGNRTEAAFRQFCANDLIRMCTQNPGRLTEQEAYDVTHSLTDLLEVLGDQADM